MIFPVKQPYEITTKFNAVTHPGIDIAPLNPGQTTRQILAPEACTVFQTGYVATYEGNYYILKGKVKYYYFGHLARRDVAQGQSVKEGQSIGIIGQTGLATGIHTHHEVRDLPFSSGRIDPLAYYKANVKEEVMPTPGEINTIIFWLTAVAGKKRKATAAEMNKFSKLPWSDFVNYYSQIAPKYL